MRAAGEPAARVEVSPEAQAVMNGLMSRRASAGFVHHGVDERRRELDAMAVVYPLPGDVMVEQVDAAGVPCEWLWARDASRGCLLYLHGGGYTRGSIASHRELAARIGRVAGLAALVVGYRLAPEHPFPAAVEDAETAYRWVVERAGVDPSAIVLAGDSAGGGLCVSLLVRLRDLGLPRPAGAVLMSPWTDLRKNAAAFWVDPGVDPVLSLSDFEFSVRGYLGSSPADDPACSPQLADLRGLPPLLVLVGDASSFWATR